MKLLYAFTILWTYFTTAKGLNCQTCLNTTDPQCVSDASVTCTTETMCVTATTQVNLGGLPSTIITKQCAPPTTCPTVGTQTVTMNVGLRNLETLALCCDTDNCNTATLPAPTRNTTINGLDCNFCLPNTELCTIIIGCEGNENTCFQGRVTGGPIGDDILGCASSNFCDAPPSLGTQLLQDFGTITSGPTCCSSPLCNERSTGMTTSSPTSVESTTTLAGSTTTSAGPTTTSAGPTTTSAGPTTTSVGTSPTSVTGVTDGVTTGSGGGVETDGVTIGSGTTNSSPVLTCALKGPVGVIVMIFISTFL